MARVRTGFGLDRFISGIEGVPDILATDVDVPDDKIDELAKAAEAADVTLILNSPQPDVLPAAPGTPTTVINPVPADQTVLPSSGAGLIRPDSDAPAQPEQTGTPPDTTDLSHPDSSTSEV